MRKIVNLTIEDIFNLLRKRATSSVELTLLYLERINSLNKKLNAYLTISSQKALEAAKKSDELRKNNQQLCWLSGVSVAVKDVIVTKDIKTTAGSKVLSQFRPVYDATVIERLDSVYTPILGKTNMDEFAMGSSNENSAYGPVSNPWDISRVPGGSSGGSAAAVAADLCCFALGSDTGGSIRQPASFCGVVGLKPTYGRVSRYGLIAYGSSLDTIGPITKSVKDAAYVLNIIAGKDILDSTSSREKVPDYSKNIARGVKGVRVGIPKEYFPKQLDKGVGEVVKTAIKKLEELGADLVEIELPNTDLALPVYYITAPSEASSNLSRYDAIRYGSSRDSFGNEVKRRIILGTYALSSGYYDEYYLKAAKARTLIKKEFESAFKKVEVIAAPVTPSVAFKKGEKATPLEMYLSDIFTIPANLAGIPSLSLPCGFHNNLPVGMQLMGPDFSEEKLFQIGFAYEQATLWGKQRVDQ